MAKAENSVSEPPNFKVLWGRIPPLLPTRLVHSALVIMPPVTQNLATALSTEMSIVVNCLLKSLSLLRQIVQFVQEASIAVITLLTVR